MEKLRESIAELVKFTLESHVKATLDFDLQLSPHFCSSLLMSDPADPIPQTNDNFEGVPAYPLYKPLALALHQSIVSRKFSGRLNKVKLMCEEITLKQIAVWNELMLSTGQELINCMENIKFELQVQEPFFSFLKDGMKKVEGRCAVGKYRSIVPGDVILLNKCLAFEVQDVHYYASFSEMLEAESLAQVLPGIQTIEEGLQIYRKFYREEKERSDGVLAIFLSKVATQPFIFLGGIFSALCEDVCYMLSCWNKGHTNESSFNFFFDEMSINLNVLGPIMLNWIVGNADGCLVAIKSDRHDNWFL